MCAHRPRSPWAADARSQGRAVPRALSACAGYQKVTISQEKPAVIAVLYRTEFLMALSRDSVDPFAVDLEALKRELERS